MVLPRGKIPRGGNNVWCGPHTQGGDSSEDIVELGEEDAAGDEGDEGDNEG